MAKFKSDELVSDLTKDVQQLVAAAEHIQQNDKVKLAYVPAEGKWSIVQILEHLNAYGRYYLPIIDNAIALKKDDPDAWFQSGFLGDYFTKSMKPTNVFEIKNKMKTSKAYNFPNSLNVDIVLNEYLEQKQKLLLLLEESKERNLNTVRIPITLTKMVKLKLGDTFRFLVAHEQRHMVQARNTLKGLGIATDKFPVILEIPHR
ncbi:MAG: DinB family protein [Chitinophagaceae bacterium]